MSHERDYESIRISLEKWLSEQMPEVADVALSAMKPASGGLSSETVFCTASWTAAREQVSKRVVLRIRPETHQVIPDPDPIAQYNMMKTLGERSAIPVPGMWMAEPTGSVIGSPFFIMEEVTGVVLLPADPQPANPERGEKPLWSRADLERIYRQALAVLVELHRTDPAGDFEYLRWPGETALDGALAQTRRWYEWAKRGRDLGIVDVAMEWVEANKPSVGECCVCWGDARPGNMIVAHDLSIAAVLDWEMAFLGPPEADLGWWLMFEKVGFDGFKMPKPEGVPSREETIATYEALSGRPVRDIHYFEILAALKLAIINVRLLELNAYGDMADGWILEQTHDRMILGDPFTRQLGEWMGLDARGRASTPS